MLRMDYIYTSRHDSWTGSNYIAGFLGLYECRFLYKKYFGRKYLVSLFNSKVLSTGLILQLKLDKTVPRYKTCSKTPNDSQEMISRRGQIDRHSPLLYESPTHVRSRKNIRKIYHQKRPHWFSRLGPIRYKAKRPFYIKLYQAQQIQSLK